MAGQFRRRLDLWRKNFSRNWSLFSRNKLGIIGIIILVIFMLIALSHPLYVHWRGYEMYEPLIGEDFDIDGINPPSLAHPLGTDDWTRDIYSQLSKGAQLAFAVGIISAMTSVIIGLIIGLTAGYFGGIIDTILMRLTDIILTLPSIPLIIIVGAAFGRSSIWVMIGIIGLLSWPSTARVVRAQTLSLKTRPFVEAARVAGAGHTRIIWRHIAPNVMPLAFLYMTFLVTWAILTEAGLSFIGLGDPSSVSWGMMLSWCFSAGKTYQAWYWILPPGLCISFLTLAFYFIGRAMDEVVNPRLQER
jgi:peptide/nickel transport system permease protein